MRLLSAQLRRANATSPERVRLSTGKPAFAQPRVADAVDKVPFPKVQGPADRNCPCRLELHYMTGFDSGNSRGCFPISNGGTPLFGAALSAAIGRTIALSSASDSR